MTEEKNEEKTSEKTDETEEDLFGGDETFDDEDKSSDKEQETSKKPDTTSEEEDKLTSDELETKNRRLMARLTKENEKLYKTLKDTEQKRKDAEMPDPIRLAKTIATLKDYSPEELDYIGLISKAKNISLEEAVKTKEVELFIPAHREGLKKEGKGLPPTTGKSISTESPGKHPNVWDMTKEEFQIYQREIEQKGREKE